MPRSLSIPASVVPVVYRVKVMSAGEEIAASTVNTLPADMRTIADRVIRAYAEQGMSVTVDYWPA